MESSPQAPRNRNCASSEGIGAKKTSACDRLSRLEGAARHYKCHSGYEDINTKLAFFRIMRDWCKGKKVLEVGSGYGVMTRELVSTASAVTVVEPARRFSSFLTEELGSSITLCPCFLDEIDHPTTHDVAVLASLLHHLEDPRAFLQNLKRFLSPDGVVLATVPNVRSLHRLVGMRAGLINDVTSDSEANKLYGVHQKFDLSAFVTLFEDADFVVVESYGYMLKPFSSEQMEQLALDGDVINALFDLGKEYGEIASQLFVRGRLP